MHYSENAKTTEQRKILKATREKQFTYKGKPIRITSDLSTKPLKSRKHQIIYFKL
jgi:hypothetical protein